MARHDLAFSPLKLDRKSALSEHYLRKLHEAKGGFEHEAHIFWSGPHNEYGYPAHVVNGKTFPLNSYFLYKNDYFTLAKDECVRTICGVGNCCQTAHMRVFPRTIMGQRYSQTQAIFNKLKSEGK